MKTKAVISKKSKKIPVIFLALCLCVLICIIVAVALGERSSVSVNDNKISISELVLYAKESRAAVAAQFARDNNINETGKSFWSTEYNGETPYQALFKNAVNQAAQNIIVLEQAKRLKVDAPASYDELVKQYEIKLKDNKTSGEITYGPQNMSLLQFQASTMQACSDDIKEALLAGESAPTPEELEKAFEELDEEVKATDFIAYGFKYTPLNNSEINDIETALNSKKTDEELRTISEKSEFKFSSAEVHREDVAQSVLREIILKKGENVPFIYENAGYITTKLEGGEPLTPAEAPRLAESKYINDVYDELIARELEKAKIIIDKGALNAFIKELEKK